MRLLRRVGALSVLAGLLVLLPATAAQAHPLGNFTINHYNGIELHPDRVDVLAIVDNAEIPTAQAMSSIDTNSDGMASAGELAAYAQAECGQVAAHVTADVDGRALQWTVQGSAAQAIPGVAGLPTLRLTCPLSAPADLSGKATLNLSDDYRSDHIGWHEITATGTGVRLLAPSVPAKTISDELRAYPNDLLASPLDVHSVTLQTEPGEGATPGNVNLSSGSADPFTRFIAAADLRLQGLIGPDMTPFVGAIAIVLAILLGAGHALLPGHGKTVMAAYLAGRRGSKRDAMVVGATVTGTHTVGVLVLGVLLSVFTTLAGEQLLRWLGVISGLLVAGIGISLLRAATRIRRASVASLERAEVLVGAGAGGYEHPSGHDHDHPADHDHSGDYDHSHGHSHSHGPGQSHTHGYGRSGLIGMGIAGGLVPSPSALVVLLASIALGRTVFGVVLVFVYGFGMAATLTAVGLLLVRIRTRLAGRNSARGLRLRASKVAAALPVLTAVLVLVVGLGLAARGLVSV